MKQEFDFNTKEPWSFRDALVPFGWVFFYLALISGYFILDEQYDSTINESKSVRSDIKTTQGGLFTYEMNDTIIIYKPITHLDPLVGRILKY